MHTSNFKQKNSWLSKFTMRNQNFNLPQKFYFNKGILIDAQRFSLLDDVLDEEYGCINFANKKNKIVNVKTFLNLIKAKIARMLFKVGINVLFILYFITHLNYKYK